MRKGRGAVAEGYFLLFSFSPPRVYWWWKAASGSPGGEGAHVAPGKHQKGGIFHANHDPPIQFTPVLFDNPLEKLSLAQEEQQRPLLPSLLFPLSLENEQSWDGAATWNIPSFLCWHKAQRAPKAKSLLPQQHITNSVPQLGPFIPLSKYFLENGTELKPWQPPGLFTLSIALEMSGSNYFEKVHSPEWRWRMLNVFKLEVNTAERERRCSSGWLKQKCTKDWALQQQSGTKGMLRMPQSRDSFWGEMEKPSFIPGQTHLLVLFSQTVPWTPDLASGWAEVALKQPGQPQGEGTKQERGQQPQDSCGEAGKWFIIQKDLSQFSYNIGFWCFVANTGPGRLTITFCITVKSAGVKSWERW